MYHRIATISDTKNMKALKCLRSCIFLYNHVQQRDIDM